jgi:hypothetical protein
MPYIVISRSCLERPGSRRVVLTSRLRQRRTHFNTKVIP